MEEIKPESNFLTQLLKIWIRHPSARAAPLYAQHLKYSQFQWAQTLGAEMSHLAIPIAID
jgi:hypothetical protein